ncbi:MAG TPA: hypothetical protein VHR41_10270 [Gemmatimonadales bacterium]|jgi:hypothetical protein|nr:hypothetical protein [Gemmatimonadales bacterium]
MTDDQVEAQPGFYNDDRAWGNWMAEREDDAAVSDAIGRLKAEAILTFKTDGWEDEDVAWVSPQELREAAVRLRAAVHAGAPEMRVILASYERNANHIDPISEEFVRDLDDIEAITRWAEAEGATKMTLEVNW